MKVKSPIQNNNKLLGSLEQTIMDIVWESNKGMKISDVHKLIPEDKAYTSVMTVMNRLVDKGLLERTKKKNYFIYKAKKSKESFVSKRIKNIFSSILSSYDKLAIAEFVETVSEDPENLEMLKKYLKDRNE